MAEYGEGNREIERSVIQRETERVTALLAGESLPFDSRLAAKAFWLEFATGQEGVNATRSGKLFLPEQRNGELVAIYAGLPGEDTVKREQRFANGLTKQGYTVWVPRHNGIRLTPENESL